MTETVTTSVTIRRAQPGEAGVVFGLVEKLAVYERLELEVDVTEAMLDDALFGQCPRIFCDFAELDGRPVGFALWFYNFSTFKGRHGIYLEDLFVEPEYQGRGIGKKLLRHLARRCVDEGLSRFEWWVLDGNESSTAFYKSLKSLAMDEWTVFRLTGEALEALADGRPVEPAIEGLNPREAWD